MPDVLTAVCNIGNSDNWHEFCLNSVLFFVSLLVYHLQSHRNTLYENKSYLQVYSSGSVRGLWLFSQSCLLYSGAKRSSYSAHNVDKKGEEEDKDTKTP